MSERINDPIAVLIVDDEPAVLRSWREILRDERYEVKLFNDPLQVAKKLDRIEVDVAVIDIRMPVMDGMKLLSTIKSRRPEVEVVMMTGYGGVQDAVEAIKRGAYDFLSKPFESTSAAELTVRRAAELRRLARRVDQLEREKKGNAISSIVGQSPAIKRIVDLVHTVAASSATVLILGESGTGKEMIARAIHESSPRNDAPLIAINCSALSETLLESELFGHVKGAFTDARKHNPGLFVAAHKGTLFLDDIGDMAPATQVKLLRALQGGEVRPVGSAEVATVDVRVVAATHRDLEAEVRNGRFREDLFYRLNVVRLKLPPLRERGDDVVLLAHHFLRKHAQKANKVFTGIDTDALATLASFCWPGNIRQLENAIEQSVVLSHGPTLCQKDLPHEVTQQVATRNAPPEPDLFEQPFSVAKSATLKQFERRYLAQLLAKHPTIAAAARAAGLDRSNFRRLLKRHESLT